MATLNLAPWTVDSSTLQNRHGRGVIRRMAQADEQPFCATRREQLFAFTVQHHKRFAGFLAPDFHVLPAECRADAGAERFGNGFLGREPRREERGRVFVRPAIRDFAWQQNPVHEPLAEFFVGGGDARHGACDGH